MIGEEILLEIDSTLDRLIGNAEAIEHVNLNELSENELEAFQQTQESLLHHLLHLDQHLEMKNDALKKPNQKSAGIQIREKRLRFEYMKERYQPSLNKNLCRRSEILAKRREKRLLTIY